MAVGLRWNRGRGAKKETGTRREERTDAERDPDREPDVRGRRKVDCQTPFPSDTHAGQRESDPRTGGRDQDEDPWSLTTLTNSRDGPASLCPFPSAAPGPQQPRKLTHLLQL